MVFEGLERAPAGALQARFAQWAESSRFRAFAATYRDKLRKKLRLVHDAEGLRDLELELEVAARLLADRRFTIEYEKHATTGRRYPDLVVTFRERTVVHMEVKRMRAVGADPDAKCGAVVCDAVQQLVPNACNAVAIGLPPGVAPTPDPARALRALRLRAERKDGVYFQRRDFTDARGFLRCFERLSALVMIGDIPDAHVELNALARWPLPVELARALERASAT